MYQNNRIVACTPYGRELTVSILLKYMEREHAKGLLDEWQLWMNTDPHQQPDREYGYRIASEYDWIVTKERPAHRDTSHSHKQYNTRTFFEYCTEPDTVYVRFDDDIVYLHHDALRNLVDVKLRLSQSSLCVFPIIWNNAISSWHLQQRGKIPREFGIVGSAYCMDPVGWADPYFAEKIHRMLLDKIRAHEVESLFFYQDVQLAPRQQFSVSCFATESRDYRLLNPPGYFDSTDDEYWHTVLRPQETGQSNMITGNSLISHFTFYPQRDYILNTDILDQYRSIANNLGS